MKAEVPKCKKIRWYKNVRKFLVPEKNFATFYYNNNLLKTPSVLTIQWRTLGKLDNLVQNFFGIFSLSDRPLWHFDFSLTSTFNPKDQLFLTFWYSFSYILVLYDFSDILVLSEQKNLECLKIFLTFCDVTLGLNHIKLQYVHMIVHMKCCSLTWFNPGPNVTL